MAGHYPYCPGPGDVATWGPVISPRDPRWEEDEEDVTPEESVPEDEEDEDPDPDDTDTIPSSLLGVIIAQILDPTGSAHKPALPTHITCNTKTKKKYRRNKSPFSIEKWASIVAALVESRPGISACEIRTATGITSKSWLKACAMLTGKMFRIDDGRIHRYFIGVKPLNRPAQRALLRSVKPS
jgi:hypothetical protein